MIRITEKTTIILQLLFLMCLYLTIRLPLLDKPLHHDEVYNTFLYLRLTPLSAEESYSQKNVSITEIKDWNWSRWRTDWRRQIATHPPFLSGFYYVWIRIFGDSEVSLHFPAMLTGLFSLFVLYFFGSILFGRKVSFFATAAVLLSPSHILYSTQAVHAIFELSIFLISLSYLYKFLFYRSNKLFMYLIVLNILGFFIFYHYIVYFIIQILIIIICAKNIKGFNLYRIFSLIVCATFFTYFLVNFFRGHYSYIFGLQHKILMLLGSMNILPFYHAMLPKGNLLFAGIMLLVLLFILFLFGCIRAFFAVKPLRKPKNILRVGLAILFMVPFFLLFVGFHINVKIGGSRNFFYLLPIYFLMIFYGLENIIGSKKMFNIIGAIIISFILFMGAHNVYMPLKINYAERRALQYAANTNAEYVIMTNNEIDFWVFIYYADRLGCINKVYRFNRISEEERISLFNLMLRSGEKITIETIRDNSFSKKGEYAIGGKKLATDNTEFLRGYFGPYSMLQEFADKPTIIEKEYIKKYF